jgi:hypothetical protein
MVEVTMVRDMHEEDACGFKAQALAVLVRYNRRLSPRGPLPIDGGRIMASRLMCADVRDACVGEVAASRGMNVYGMQVDRMVGNSVTAPDTALAGMGFTFVSTVVVTVRHLQSGRISEGGAITWVTTVLHMTPPAHLVSFWVTWFSLRDSVVFLLFDPIGGAETFVCTVMKERERIQHR